MERYLLALEAFESETHDIYADYLIGQMVATEGFKENIGARIKQGWETVKRIALQIWEWIKRAGRTVRDAVFKFHKVLHDTPDFMEVELERQEAKLEELRRRAEQTSAEAEKAVADAAKMQDRLEKIVEDAYAEFRKIDPTFGEIDELTAKMQEENARKLDEYMQAMSIDGFPIVESTRGRAMDSFTMATEASSGFKFNLSNIKSHSDKATANAADNLKKNESLIARVRDMISTAEKKCNEDPENTETTKIQRILSRILKALGTIGRFFASIPSKVHGIFTAVMKARTKTTVKEYDGPDPEIG